MEITLYREINYTYRMYTNLWCTFKIRPIDKTSPDMSKQWKKFNCQITPLFEKIVENALERLYRIG